MKGFRVVAAAQGEVEEMARPDALPDKHSFELSMPVFAVAI